MVEAFIDEPGDFWNLGAVTLPAAANIGQRLHASVAVQVRGGFGEQLFQRGAVMHPGEDRRDAFEMDAKVRAGGTVSLDVGLHEDGSAILQRPVGQNRRRQTQRGQDLVPGDLRPEFYEADAPLSAREVGFVPPALGQGEIPVRGLNVFLQKGLNLPLVASSSLSGGMGNIHWQIQQPYVSSARTASIMRRALRTPTGLVSR